MRVEKINREGTYMQNGKDKNNLKMKIFALVMAGFMVFSAVAGVLGFILG